MTPPSRPTSRSVRVAACIQDLIARGLLVEAKDRRVVPDRQQLVALWVQAYVDVLRPKLTERRFQVRAETKPEIWERLGDVLGKRDVRWALTGADAAERTTNYFHAEDTEIYAPLDAFRDREVLKRLRSTAGCARREPARHRAARPCRDAEQN